MSKAIHLAILVADMDRADLAIEDFWRTARSAVPSDVQLSCTAVHAAIPGDSAIAGHPALKIVPLTVPDHGPAARTFTSIARGKGPVGVIGRLGAYNISAHRIARALARNRALTETLCAADIVVSADPHADWAVWNLRNKTAAPLIHGPFAMANALSEMARA
ncbi:hypothetical protein JOF48_002563 [Arthrobacter stackebrandtii]|uniref:Uncharacterized protein n=1 Tax=Arthrobacter stackebrandtii TaxID=272161 RepID=A0ABS4YYE9_9MICC|nr:hypothetical protein [Arthrobacter stackebrandtii]MBP2413764.1 hypothetical protein [Arthrobacter stackebrandtii]PYG98710.1 hypothetical protein CVV67_19130 [Arthrobacter stackebrandtii]